MKTYPLYLRVVNYKQLIYKQIVYCLFIFLTFCNTYIYGQEFNWSWASQIHGTHGDGISAVKSNIKGEILVTGIFQSTAIEWENDLLINPYENYNNGIYLGKLNTQGELLWTSQIFCAPGNYKSDVYFRDADLNSFGESFISGHVYRNGIAIDTFILYTSEEYSSSGFITRFDTNGKILWAHVFEEGCEVSSVVADANGGFYIMGNMYWFCPQIDFGDTIIHNTITQNQAYIAHYNNDNTIDWAKLVQGYINDIQGQLTDDNNLLVSGNYQINGYLNTLKIDQLTLICPPTTYYCSFWGELNQEGEVQWLHNVAQDDISLNGFYKLKDSYKQLIWFSDPFVIVQGDTLYANPDNYYTSVLLSFDLNGNLLNSASVPLYISDAYYNLFKSPTDSWFATLLLSDSLTCQNEFIFNADLKKDPIIVQLDSEFSSISCYQQELKYDASAGQLTWDRYGNMLLIGNFSGDTLVFDDDVLTNYQLQSQSDYYLAYGNRCDTVMPPLIMQNNLLFAPNGLSWIWYFNNNLLPQENAQVLAPEQPGYYTASVAQEDGCVLWTKPCLFNQDNKTNPIFIYPNPSDGNCYVILPESASYFKIFDLAGKLVYTCLPATQINLELSHLSSGIYYIKAGDEQSEYNAKFIIF